jgi:hypothetical protein
MRQFAGLSLSVALPVGAALRIDRVAIHRFLLAARYSPIALYRQTAFVISMRRAALLSLQGHWTCILLKRAGNAAGQL